MNGRARPGMGEPNQCRFLVESDFVELRGRRYRAGFSTVRSLYFPTVSTPISSSCFPST